MSKVTVALVVLGMCALAAHADDTMFPVTKDTCIIGSQSGSHGQQNVNLGFRAPYRFAKGGDDTPLDGTTQGDGNESGEYGLFGWGLYGLDGGVDVPEAITAMRAWLTAEVATIPIPGITVEQARDQGLMRGSFRWVSQPSFATQYPPQWPETPIGVDGKEVYIRAAYSLNEWYESDGEDGNATYAWTHDYDGDMWPDYAATAAYAGDSPEFTGPTPIPWKRPSDGLDVGNFFDIDFLYNSTFMAGMATTTDAEHAAGNDNWNALGLDVQIVYDVVMEDNCVGLNTFGKGWYHTDPLPLPWPTESPDLPEYENQNASINMEEQWGDATTPELAIYVARAGDSDVDGDVDLGDLNVLGLNYNQAPPPAGFEWADCDFDDDNDVDLGDLNVLGLNFFYEATLVDEWRAQAGASGAAVPEPASLVLLALGATAVMIRRRRR